jgi:uncharacterized repeat protein (TIGR03803 family)
MKNSHPALISNALTLAANTGGRFVLVLVLAVVAIRSAQAQSLQVLYSFPASSNNGVPEAGVIRDSAGNLYGDTFGGYACALPTFGLGSIFEIDSSGRETDLHNFSGPDGACPLGELLRDREGNLFGTTFAGGVDNYGTVFKVDRGGVETVLHSFPSPGQSSDGCTPEAGLVQDKAGNLYGTTTMCGAFEMGTVFKIDQTGTESILHSFKGDDGSSPMGLIIDANGNLYGIASTVLYKISARGRFTVLHKFADCHSTFGSPLLDKDGNLYGTALCRASAFGIVWKRRKDRTVTVLHKFTGPEGAYPSDHGLILDEQHNLYGVAMGGGVSNDGTVYKLSADGTITLLHTFTEASAAKEGAYPSGRLTMDRKGNLYGTTMFGGEGGIGTVWKLKPCDSGMVLPGSCR